MYNIYDYLKDDLLSLVHLSFQEAEPEEGILPRYGFSIICKRTSQEVGVIFFVLDRTRRQYIKGHLSYGIHEEHRGNRYAARACRLLIPFIQDQGYDRVFIGAKLSNLASLKTIKAIGARPVSLEDGIRLVEVDKLKKDQVAMFVWELGHDNPK